MTHMALNFGASLLACGMLIVLPGSAVVAQDKPMTGATKSFADGGKSLQRLYAKGTVAKSGNAGSAGAGPARGGSANSNPAGRDKWGRIDKRYTGQRCETIESGVRVQRGC